MGQRWKERGRGDDEITEDTISAPCCVCNLWRVGFMTLDTGYAADFRIPYCALYPDTVRLVNTQHVIAVLLCIYLYISENQQASGIKACAASSKKMCVNIIL